MTADNATLVQNN